MGNSIGNPVLIKYANATYNGKTYSTNVSETIAPGSTGRIFILNGCANASNARFSSKVTIVYTEPGQPTPGPYISVGYITGVTSSFVQNTVANFTVNKSQIYIPNSTTTYSMWQGGPYTFSAWVNLTYDSPTCQHYPCVALIQVEYGCTSAFRITKRIPAVSGQMSSNGTIHIHHAGLVKLRRLFLSHSTSGFL